MPDPERVRYARVSANGTAGYVDVRCIRDPDGTCVTVEYDLTATREIGRAALEDFDRGFDMMLEEWRQLTSQLLPRPA